MHHSTLLQITRRLQDLDPAQTIYAVEPWSPTAPAAVAEEPDDGSVPVATESLRYRYFLEVSIAKEVIGGFQGTPKEVCQRLIHYAVNDA